MHTRAVLRVLVSPDLYYLFCSLGKTNLSVWNPWLVMILNYTDFDLQIHLPFFRETRRNAGGTCWIVP